MEILPANGNEQFDREQVENYIRHIRCLYDAKRTECFRKMLISDTNPCTFSLTRIINLPWKWPEEEEPYWQLICFTNDAYGHPLEREYYFTDDGQIRFLRETRENRAGSTIIELDTSESFVSWEETDESPEDGLGWVMRTYEYDENGHIIDRDWEY